MCLVVDASTTGVTPFFIATTVWQLKSYTQVQISQPKSSITTLLVVDAFTAGTTNACLIADP
jgi:hypothetical protein